jgi:hypothetical protein
MWTYDQANVDGNREIDMEVRIDGNEAGNFQYVVRYYSDAGHLQRVTLPMGNLNSTQQFVWKPKTVDFHSSNGVVVGGSGTLPGDWTFPDAMTPMGSYHDPPAPGNEKVWIALYLFDNTKKPTGITDVAIENFTYTP